MPIDQPGGVLRQLRRAALLPDGAGMTDGQLLECFVLRRDEAAFEALVRRHGPMVLAVCRRVVHNYHDAEDAFQATFLVLACKAAGIARRELVGNWLYGVAYRTALDARSATLRRRGRQNLLSTIAEPDTTDLWRELRPILDQELNRLPDKYRVPVVLCDLEGRTRRSVARQLGIPTGTLSGRLTTARRTLARRLARRGLVLSTAGATATLSREAASACVPAPLRGSTVQAATSIAAGEAATTVVSAKVAALTEQAGKAMFLTTSKIATALVLLLAITIGASLLARQPASEPLDGQKTEKPQAASPDDREAKAPALPRILKLGAGQRGRRVVWSPDGKTLIVVTKFESVFSRNGSAIKLWDADKGEARQTLAESTEKGLAFQHVVFSADGKTIAATVSELVRKPDLLTFRDVIKLWDAQTLTLKRTLGEAEDSQLVCLALSPDGKLAAAGDPAKKRVKLWNAGTGALVRTLSTAAAQPWSVMFAPDSKALVVGGQKADHSGVVSIWNAETGKLNHTWEPGQYVNSVVYTPDGKMVAAGGAGGEIELWDADKGKHIASLHGLAHGTRSVAFSPDGKTVAAGGPDGKIHLWSVPTGKLSATLEGHESEVYSVAFSPDGKRLASVSQDQTIRLWNVDRPSGAKK
jgi:RNA polymerase sigma factor (sigma-70 family)